MSLAPRPLQPVILALALLSLLALGAVGCGGGGKAPPEDPPPTDGLVVTTVTPGQGISVQQVDFYLPGGSELGSTWGRLLVDRAELQEKTGLRDGYISVLTARGWAIVNMPVPGAEEPPCAMYFDLALPQSTEIGETDINVMHASRALADPTQYMTDRINFPVETWVERAHGIGPADAMEEIGPPTIPPFTYKLADLPIFAGLTESNYQAITNIQCAVNQCFPMATANCLQFLEDSGVILLFNDHSQGIGVVGDPTAGTLVGQLDQYADRTVTSRLSGEGVWFDPMITGTFSYLDDNGYAGLLTFRHQDYGYGETIATGDYSVHGSTSLDDGATVSWTWINDRIKDGCGVSMVYVPHAVRITGSGRTLGARWIRYSHDSNQHNDASGLENVVTYLTDPDTDGLLNMDGSSREVRWVWAACP